ncbi:MAG TPA: HAMP domain-containing sensor histidine kinase [Candidatus Saccharimonadales bacterium]|nr:HAMP domain-containing sensor histidine kinase [Candidatus Saccharimonadales bacterium]
MDHIQRFTRQLRDYLLALLVINNLVILLDWWIVEQVLHITGYWALAALLLVPLLSVSLLPWISTRYLVQPTKLIWQAILHIAPDTANTAAPDLQKSHFGKDLVTYLVGHIYQMASIVENIEKTANKPKTDLTTDFVASSLPLPLLVLDQQETILFANKAMLNYIKKVKSDVVGKSLYSVIDMAFSSEHTFDDWLKAAKADKVTDTRTWERVRLNLGDSHITRLLDLAAYYNKNNPEHFETMLVFFDHTIQYSQDDQAMNYVAVAVHELRTPITLLRGYVEAFEEELDGKATGELADFMQKMRAASQQLTAFVDNILNVARIENDQLALTLHEGQWPDILQSAVGDMQLRAEVRGIKLELQIDKDLPTVAADRVSIYEVISNLIDNAIKYSGTSKRITIHSYASKNGVETTVQDFGVGIPISAMPNLFEKFYRNHRSRNQIGGTGLGLYLSKAIIDAHGGHIWVHSKEGEGTTFGFSLPAYKDVAATLRNQDNNDIVRGAHGWIKNHSMYRR